MDRNADFLRLTALEQLELLRSRRLSAVELMAATYDRLEARNPTLNALVNVLPREQALALAEAADQRYSDGERAPLLGLPMAPKDAEDVSGFPTTFGFAPYADRVAQSDGTMVARMREAGALFIGKSNMPEFGLGSHTFNSLFGHTYNPYDPSRTPGGSSGGAAVALATGMLAVADGSDMGGSLRNPASFCNVVGFRPSIGRVPDNRALGWFGRIATAGPMARTVRDCARLLSVQAGYLASDPLSLSGDGAEFDRDLATDLSGLNIAYSPDLGGLPIDPEVRAVIAEAPAIFETLGCHVEETMPDLQGAMEIFTAQRAAGLAATGRAMDRVVPDWRNHAKDTAIWNIEQGLAISSEALIQSEVARTALYRRITPFFERYDALILPAAQVPPFDASLDWVHEIDGVTMPTYLDWMTVCCVISVTGLPAVSVPAGFTPQGLPVGLQIVGKPRGDLALLQLAAGFEQATKHHERRPEFSA